MTDHTEVTSGASSSRPAPNPYDRAHGTEVKPGERCVVKGETVLFVGADPRGGTSSGWVVRNDPHSQPQPVPLREIILPEPKPLIHVGFTEEERRETELALMARDRAQPAICARCSALRKIREVRG
jgi:hypothetical protein